MLVCCVVFSRMKRHLAAAMLAFGLFQSSSLSRAGELFNPIPERVELPRDDADAAVKRLTASADGKTPVVKKLDAAWIKTLADRGEPTIYTRSNSQNFSYLGMPIGGIGAGELYLSGDGRLWEWDIFGTRCKAGFPVEQGVAYEHPHKANDVHDTSQQVLDQGFVVRTRQGEKVDTRRLDQTGFSSVTFLGQYPIGSVDYADPASPVRVHLEAFSPFIPSDVADSSYPATVLNYTVENTSAAPVECTVGGWLENAAGTVIRRETPVSLENTAAKSAGYTAINFSVRENTGSHLPPKTFADFETGNYDGWTVEGDAFGSRPARPGEIQHTTPIVGAQGQYFVDTYLHGDQATGKLTSAPFVIERPYLNFLIGGGNNPRQECMNLVIDGKTVRTASGQNDEHLRPTTWAVKDLLGRTAHLEIVDQGTGGWGHILVDDISFADTGAIAARDQPDFGNMTLALLGDASEAIAQVAGENPAAACLDAPASASAELKNPEIQGKLVGALRRTRSLAPGEKMTASFLVSWYFPNPLSLGLATPTNRSYGARFKSAEDVAAHLAADFDRLTAATRSWRDTWYDSTLPYYFLDRTFLNVSTLATSTAYLLGDGRFYGYEGGYSCPGTCTHVWGYQQALGCLFPDLEKALMEKAEFVPGLGMNAQGGVAMRGEYDRNPPVDGQAGIILRAYLAHRMSADDSFLRRNYAAVKKATDYLIGKNDPKHEGLLEGGQANTMDAAWFGKISWLSLHYQAALRATAEMADVLHDGTYAQTLRALADKGRHAIETQLFNGEYFIQRTDPAHPDSPGTFNGCPIEQLMGQNWAYEVGLGEIIDRGKTLSALDAMWKYNYTTDAGLYRNTFKAGRWYAMAGEGGLIMCTFPHGGEEALAKGNAGFAAYDNECWSGSEHEAAALMMWEGQVDKALAEIKTLQERYDGAKRNPWDECECGSHYSRAMSSYGVFVAACGFEYNGPEGAMTFAPRVGPEHFKSAFISAEGWGSFEQKSVDGGLSASVALRYGKVRLKTLNLILPVGSTVHTVTAHVDAKALPVTTTRTGDRISLHFSADLVLASGQSVEIEID